MNYWNPDVPQKSRRRSRRRSRESAMKASALVLFFGSLGTAAFFLVEGLPR
jgi:hypothetical protein